MENQKYIKASDVAQRFGVTRQTIRNWIEKGLLTSEKLDGCHYVTIASVNAIEDKYSDVVVEEGSVDYYLKSLRTLEEEYRKSVEEYRSSIIENKVLTTLRLTLARFIPVVYDLLQDGLPTTKRGCKIIQSVIVGEDIRSISQEHGLTPERVRQILEKEMRLIQQKALRYHILRKENARLEAENAVLRLNAKNIDDIVAIRTSKDVPDSILTKRLAYCGLSVRALNCLHSYKECVDGVLVESPIETVGELTRINQADLLRTRNCGKKTVAEIDKFLTNLGLELGKRYIVQNDGSIVEISSTS